MCATAFAPVLLVLAGVTFWLALAAGVLLGVAGGWLVGRWWALALVTPAAFVAAVLAAYTWPPPTWATPTGSPGRC